MTPARTLPLVPPQPGPSHEPSPGGAGAPDAAGSRPGRRRLHSSGRSGGSAARALLGARAGAQGAEGRGQRGGARRGVVCVAPPTYSHPAPQATLQTRRRPGPFHTLRRKVKGTKTGIYADREAKGQKRTWPRDEVSGKPLERGLQGACSFHGERGKRMRAPNPVIAPGKDAREGRERTPEVQKACEWPRHDEATSPPTGLGRRL